MAATRLRVLKLAVAWTWSIRALANCTSRRAICRLGWGILRNSNGLVRRGSRLMNLVVSGRGAFFSASLKGLIPAMAGAT